MEAAFFALLAYNRGVDGRPVDYGLRVDAATADASEFELTLTFKAGVCYCCAELGCHMDYWDAGWWRRLRRVMRSRGLAPPAPLVVRRLRTVAEPGTRLACLTDFGRGKRRSDASRGFTAEAGPFVEVVDPA